MCKALMMLAIMGGVLALGACASQPPAGQTSQKMAQDQQQTTAQDQRTRKVCVSGAPLGSHLVQTHCVTMTLTQYEAYQKAQQEKQQKSHEATMHQQDQGGPE